MPGNSHFRKFTKAISFSAAILFLLPVPRAQADSLSPSVLALFPKNASEIAYSDFAHARQLPWFAQFKHQTLPAGFGELDSFLSSVGIDPNKQIDQIAWALVASDDPADAAIDAAENAAQNSPSQNVADTTAATQNSAAGAPSHPANSAPTAIHHKLPAYDDLLAIVLGQFDTQSSEAILEKNKAPSIEWLGHTLYQCGSSCHDFYFMFLDSSTLAFGKASLLEHMLGVRSGGEESVFSNKVLSPLIRKINDGGIFWGVLNDAGTSQALLQLIPEAAKFPDAAKLISKMQNMAISIEGDDELHAELDVSAAPEDAVPLTQLMQAGLLFRQFQASQDDPQFARILRNVTIVPGGPGIQITFDITSDQMVSLIQHNTFSPKI
jgi:hypothetical protein